MLKCSYIIIIHNNENTIAEVVDSLKEINGNFKREFIFINDGSNDNSLGILKSYVAPLPKVTIINNKTTIGPAQCINKVIRLAQGDYIHFLDGSEIIDPNTTIKLIECCKNTGREVAFGLTGCSPSNYPTSTTITLIEQPIKEILINKIPNIRNIGLPGSLVCLNLLKKVGLADSQIYTANMSLSLRCAQYSKFAFLNEIVSTKVHIEGAPIDKEFEVYNNLQAIYNFITHNKDLFINYKPQLITALVNELKKVHSRFPYSYLLSYLKSKYLKSMLNLDRIIQQYKVELEKLF